MILKPNYLLPVVVSILRRGLPFQNSTTPYTCAPLLTAPKAELPNITQTSLFPQIPWGPRLYSLGLMILLAGHLLAAATPIIDPKAKKNFLEKPVFKNTIEYQYYKAELKKAEDQKNGIVVPSGKPVLIQTAKKPKLNLDAQSSGGPQNKGRGVVETQPQAIVVPLSVPKPSGAVVPVPTHCGFTAYTKDFCLYQAKAGDWTLCTQRWGRCLNRYAQ